MGAVIIILVILACIAFASAEINDRAGGCALSILIGLVVLAVVLVLGAKVPL
jgi:hypothetical protein